MRLNEVLASLSRSDLRRLAKAKPLQEAREAAAARVGQLGAELSRAEKKLAKLERRLAKLLGANGPVSLTVAVGRGRGARRGRRAGRGAGPRKGSLRGYLVAALKSGSLTARELAERVAKLGYKTKSNAEIFLRAVQNALYANPEFTRQGQGKFGLK